MTPSRWIAVGAVLGALGVAFGAFGAHVLDGVLARLGFVADDAVHRTAIFETAVRYQMYHAIAIVLVGVLMTSRTTSWCNAAGWAFLIGVLIFSGLLYALVLTGPTWRWLGAIVPIGGLSLIGGWILLAIGSLRN
jgi:uncharacterized membrane protein YgdD (TMEM256/DUF423 family)